MSDQTDNAKILHVRKYVNLDETAPVSTIGKRMNVIQVLGFCDSKGNLIKLVSNFNSTLPVRARIWLWLLSQLLFFGCFFTILSSYSLFGFFSTFD